jgi:SAM-dependent methyltransferase
MGLYAKHVLPRLIDAACAQPPMRALRNRYVPRAQGDVLEIGIGSGLNLEHYSGAVRSVTGLDPAPEITARARERVARCRAPVSILEVSGEAIPADDGRFDDVVCTFTLCSIPNAEQAVAEMHRVLKPGGRLYFVEHGRSDEPHIVRWQRRIEPLWKRIGGGCHLTRRPDELLRAVGFELPEFASGYVPGPKIAAFLMHGVARRPPF